MQSSHPPPLPFKGSVLIADPSLRDPHFARSVLLLTEHHPAKGAHGYILNRPMGKVVGAVLSSAEFSDLRDVPIYLGGPVRQEHLTFASLTWPAEGSGLHYRTHLTTAEAIELQRAGASVRAFLGYAGWTEGQLEEELQAEAWIRRPASPSVLSPRGPAELWRTLLCALGPWGQILAGTPDDLSLN